MFSPANHTHFSLTVEGWKNDFQVAALTGREAISQPFVFDVELVSEQPSMDLETLLHKPAFLQLSPDGSGIHGQIYRAAQGDSGKRLTRYAVTLRPQLSYLAHRINQRIFQHLSVPKIIGRVLEEHGIHSNAYAFNVGAIYPERIYCVQYDESDLQFIQRLCEEEGIHYHFQHSTTAHQLVFGDDQTVFPKLAPVAYQPDSGMVASDPVIKHFNLRLETRTSRTTRRDYDFEKPRISLESDSRDNALPDLEDYDYPGRFLDRERGKHLAKRALERHRSDFQLAEGKSDQPLLGSGHFLALTQHPKAKWNDLWLLTEIRHEGQQPQVLEESALSDTSANKDDFHWGYRNRFQATPWDVPNRPPLNHPKPRILGSQSAVVTGPKGEEIHCDQYGRVKVQFHWDRKGQADDKTSCWLRVSSAWAGTHYGGIAIPRIGMEVLVSFLEGDPDQPLITGCLYHKENVVPYDLPANKTRSTFKTQSSPGGAGFNELRIEDKKGQEQIFLHAQRDWDQNVEHNQTIRVGNERHDSVQKNSYTQLRAEEHRTTYGDRKVEVHADDYLSVGGNQHSKIGTGLFIEAGQQIHLSCGMNIVLEAGSELTFKAGGSFIKIDANGIALSGPLVKINCGDDPGGGALAEMLLPDAIPQVGADKAGTVLTPALANILDNRDNGEPIDDAAQQSLTYNDQPARAAADTCTHGCPVSMVTGEELLTLTDGHLDGVLPFEWTRLYRTSAVEIDNGLGFGWSHALSHRLHSDGEELIWTDNENRITRFPRPSAHLPVIHNSLAESAIFLGEADELVLVPSRNSTCFYHFRQERLVAITDAYRNRLSISHSLTGRLERIDNHSGRSLFFRYTNNHLVTVDYQQERNRYDADDQPQEPWVTLQTVATYRYNEAGQLLSASNALGETEHYHYDPQHVILERHLAGGAIFYWEWEREGKQSRCLHHWANFGQLDARYEWDDNGTVKVIHRDGSEQIYVHNENARLISQTDPDGAEHQKTYDEKGRLIVEKDPLGATTEYQYSDVGHLVAVLPADESPIHYQYEDGFVSQVYRGGALWQYQRNTQGDITVQTDPHANVTRYSYTQQGQLKAIHHPDGGSHHLAWNDLGQLIEETLPNGGVRHYRYDARGRNISRQNDSGAVSHYQWDALGHLTQVTLPDGATRAYSYNAYGNVTGERDELGRVTRYEYVAHLQLISRRINSDGSELKYRYDHDRLQLTEIENERGEHYRISYHSNDLISQEVGFDGTRTAYQYDLNGHLIEKIDYPGDTDSDELLTRYKRDAAGRLCEKTLPDGSKVEYRYDLQGRLVGVEDGHWPLAYEYDLQDRLVTEQQGWATLHYQYNALGQLKGLRLPDGNQLDYHYHRGGDLSSIKLNDENLTGHHFTAGREQLREQGPLLSQYQYDEQGRLTAHVLSQVKARHGAELRISGQALSQRHYNYSQNGNLKLISDSRKGQKGYRYDPLNRLLEVRGSAPERLTHDPAGNLLGQSESGLGFSRFADVKGNRVLRQGDGHFEYDAYGNLSQEWRDHGQTLVRHYRYDSLHRLSGVTLADGSDVTYRYDAFGRRIAKEHDGQQTEFVWFGEKLIVERRRPTGEQNSPHYRSYLYEPDSFKPLVLLQGEGHDAQPYHFQLDHLGTPQEITDRAGQIVWSAHYRAYGQVITLDVAQLDNPLRFQGQYYDTETGLHYNRHRYYNPNTGRFLTPDPIKLAGGLNAYKYVPNPTGWIDPLGLTPCPGEAVSQSGTIQDPASNAVLVSGDVTAPAPIYLYRGDSRIPEQIFNEGFKPRGTHTNLLNHIRRSDGIFVSTSKSRGQGCRFATQEGNNAGYLYTLNPVRGIDVSKVYPGRFDAEEEIAVPGGVKPKDIFSGQYISRRGSLGEVTYNPNFAPFSNT